MNLPYFTLLNAIKMEIDFASVGTNKFCAFEYSTFFGKIVIIKCKNSRSLRQS